MELSIPYELTGSDGTRIVFGNTELAKADPDYIGWLEPDQGIAGLDGADVRERAQDLIGTDGGLHFDFFHGRRPIVINGVIDPTLMDVVGVDELERRIIRATRAMRADSLLRWTNTVLGIERRLALRRQQRPIISGRRPKTWQSSMVSADYRLLSEALHASAATAFGVAVDVTNAGDETATPVLELTAPGGNAKGNVSIFNDTLGLELRFKAAFTIPAGKTLTVDLNPPWPTVDVDGVDHYGDVDFLNTAWFGLAPDPDAAAGVNAIRAVGTGAGGTFLVRHRDAWA